MLIFNHYCDYVLTVESTGDHDLSPKQRNLFLAVLKLFIKILSISTNHFIFNEVIAAF